MAVWTTFVGELYQEALDEMPQLSWGNSRPTDPWGHAYVYTRDDDLGVKYFRLGSYGPDGRVGKGGAGGFGAGDDLVNDGR